MTQTPVRPSALARSDRLWPWYAVTGAYLLFGGVVLYDRWNEVGSLFEPAGTNPGRLPLNSIGDILAGFFAPLAFLWLFVATQLQRKELRLQREELAETRKVLDDQRLELERSAKESNAQTEIMQRTLNVSNTSVVYEEFNIHLYFIARQFLSVNHGAFYLLDVNSAPFADRLVDYRGTITPNDSSTVDDFFRHIHDQVKNILRISQEGGRINPEQNGTYISDVVWNAVNRLNPIFKNQEYTSNNLINARISGSNLSDFHDDIKKLASMI